MNEPVKVRPRALAALLLALLSANVLQSQTIRKAEELIRAGALKEARAELDEVIRREPRNAEAHYRLAMLLLAPSFDEGEDEAADLIDRAVELEPENADYQYGKGAVYGVKAQRSGVIKQAFLAPKIKNAFLRATQLNARHVPARIALIQYYRMAPGFMGGDRELADKHTDTLIRVDHITGRIFRARMLEMDKEYDQAERELKDLAQTEGTSDRVWRGLGTYYLRRDRADDAIEPLTKYVRLRPDTADSHNSLGEAYLKKADLEKAQALFNQALRLDPSYGPALLNSGDVSRMKGEKEQARSYYRRVLAEDRSDWRRRQAEQRLKDLN